MRIEDHEKAIPLLFNHHSTPALAPHSGAGAGANDSFCINIGPPHRRSNLSIFNNTDTASECLSLLNPDDLKALATTSASHAQFIKKYIHDRDPKKTFSKLVRLKKEIDIFLSAAPPATLNEAPPRTPPF